MNESIPTTTDLLFWPPEQRSAGYRNMEKVFNTQVCPRGDQIRPLPAGEPLAIRWRHFGETLGVDDFIERNCVAGMLVMHRGKVRFEHYGRGLTPEQRWTSFSIAKSVTSTLVGAAIADGCIDGLDAPIAGFIEELRGSAYDGVTVRQVLTMTSGVKWNEDYADPNSDVARCGRDMSIVDRHPTIDYLSRLPRDAEPGTRHLYSTGETDLAGIMVTRATGKTLAAYLSEKIWAPFGMQRDAAWVCDKAGRERGGSGLSATLRDFARYGLFMLGGGVAGGRQVVPEGWTDMATVSQIPEPLQTGGGYGFQWWTTGDGAYLGLGIFGQALVIDPELEVVIANVGDWPRATDPDFANRRNTFYGSVRAAIRAEG